MRDKSFLGETHMVMMARVSPQYIELRDPLGEIQESGTINIVEVGTSEIPKAISRVGKDYENVGLISMDGLFCPYYISPTGAVHDNLPYWSIPNDLDDINSIKLNPFNPSNLFSTGVGFNRDVFYESGHNTLLLNTFRESGGTIEGDLSPYKEISEGSGNYDEIRSVGLKTPLVFTGWGYNIDGDPVPSSGEGFHPEAFRNPSLWKSGPLDIRWDEERGVWGAAPTSIYLIKMTNVYNPSCFSYEVERSPTHAQYTRNAPSGARTFSSSGTLYDPESIAYDENASNIGCYERLDYSGEEYPHYEAFIIRKTNEDTLGDRDYNLWYDDCSDCGHITNPCPSGTRIGAHGYPSRNKKVLVENPLRQSFDVGDLAFSVYTGKKKRVSGSTFSGGSGAGASGHFSTNGAGVLSFVLDAGGTGYTSGAFAIYRQPCVGLTLSASSGVVTGYSISGTTTGYTDNETYPVTIYPKNASADYEMLPIHWVIQAEFKSQQFVTHVESEGGILQSCTIKGSLQGFVSCSHCGENSSLINQFI